MRAGKGVRGEDAIGRALLRAQALLDLRRTRAACLEVRRVLSMDPGHPKAQQLLGLCLLDLEDLAGARAALREAIAGDPEDAHSHYLLGYAEREAGHGGPAERLYREALRLAPDEPVYLRALAELLAGQGRAAEARTLAERAVALAPDRAANHITLGFVLSAAGEKERARAAYGEALRLDPENAVAWNNLGCIALAEGRPMQARARFREALRLNPEGEVARDNLRLVAPPARPAEIYRDHTAFERQLVMELCEGLRPTGPLRRALASEVKLAALVLLAPGRVLPALARSRPLALLSVGVTSLSLLRLLRGAGPGPLLLVGSGALSVLLARPEVLRWRRRFVELSGRTRAEYERAQALWLSGQISRAQRDERIDRLLDDFLREVEALE